MSGPTTALKSRTRIIAERVAAFSGRSQAPWRFRRFAWDLGNEVNPSRPRSPWLSACCVGRQDRVPNLTRRHQRGFEWSPKRSAGRNRTLLLLNPKKRRVLDQRLPPRLGEAIGFVSGAPFNAGVLLNFRPRSTHAQLVLAVPLNQR